MSLLCSLNHREIFALVSASSSILLGQLHVQLQNFSATSSFKLLKTPFDSGVEVKVSTFLFYRIIVRSFTVKGGVLQNINIPSLSSVRPKKKG